MSPTDRTGGEDEEVSVRARVNPEKQVPGNPVVVEFVYDVPENWYVYSESIEVDLNGDGDESEWVSEGRISMPEKRTKFDEILEKEVDYFDGQFTVKRVLHLSSDAPQETITVPFNVAYQACSETTCHPVKEERVTVDVGILSTADEPVDVSLPEDSEDGEDETEDGFEQRADLEDVDAEEEGLWTLLLFSYVAGLGLALTPCVYPMIPITVSVIGATSSESWWDGFGRSLVYVLGISLMYATLGLIAAASGHAFGTFMQHPAVYVGLAVLFVLLAAAMFDLFSIQFVGSWANRLQQKVRGRAGLLGILLLGILSGVALTPCSAPVIIGAMGFVMRTGNMWAGFLAFFCIAWGMGTPLVLVGTFGGALNALPKSGEWQDSVKHIFGFGLLAAALYFFLHSGLLGDFWSEVVVGSFLLICGVFSGAFDRITPESSWWPRLCKSVGLLFIVAAIFVFSGPLGIQKTEPGESIEWAQSVEEARETAEEKEAPMMIYFWQENCPECDRLAEDSFVDPEVVQRSRDIVCVKFDGTDSREESVREVLSRYDVWGFPTIVFVGSDGEIVEEATRVGYVSPEELKTVMDGVIDRGQTEQ
ncbi:MAG: protein-disulfide reductase DsbD family protein [Planctomycetota bacterium]